MDAGGCEVTFHQMGLDDRIQKVNNITTVTGLTKVSVFPSFQAVAALGWSVPTPIQVGT